MMPVRTATGRYADNAPNGTLTPKAEKMNHADTRCADWNTTARPRSHAFRAKDVSLNARIMLATASRSREGKGRLPRATTD